MFVIKVQPVEGGWSVDTRDIVPMMFRSGGAAERAAHDLGRKLARTGAPVEVQIYMRGGALLLSVRLDHAQFWPLRRSRYTTAQQPPHSNLPDYGSAAAGPVRRAG